MGIKLGDVSPLAGMISGKGIMADAARNGAFGLIGKFVTPDKKKDEDKKVAPTAGGKPGMKKGGKVKKMAKGGSTRDEDKGVVDRALGTKLGFSKGGSASKRADGCATKGKTKGRFV